VVKESMDFGNRRMDKIM